MLKNKLFKLKKMNWLWIWLIQIAAMLALSMVLAWTYWLGATLHAILAWVLMPVAGCISACLATRKGLLNYAAWIAPPVMMVLGNRIVWGYSIGAGPVFFCALISLMGAAAGEVLNQRQRGK